MLIGVTVPSRCNTYKRVESEAPEASKEIRVVTKWARLTSYIQYGMGMLLLPTWTLKEESR